MAKLSKRMRAIAEKIDAEKAYGIDEAVTLLNELAGSKFKESFDIAVNLGVDPRKSDQVVRGATTLPHGTGKTVRVAVFAQGENAEKARLPALILSVLTIWLKRLKVARWTLMSLLPHRMLCVSSASWVRCLALEG